MKKNTVKGMNDYLPTEVALREYLQGRILETYTTNGFDRIITPIVEDAENLDKSDGGDNLNLIFKILKRGDKLSSAIAEKKFDDLSDMGLRYDLTLPLSRYFANNRAKLLMPMKCIQIGSVYRAERPQKGRLRELVQCDIDILGSESVNCEIELITVTAKALLNIGLKSFRIRISDRRLLRSMLLSMGFREDQLDSVCITFDKMDKIGAEGIRAELCQKEFNSQSIEKLVEVVNNLPLTLDKARQLCSDIRAIDDLEKIINGATELANDQYEVLFDLSLVRGQGYYTGTVFEIESSEFNSSIGGGGRYDNLIGKFVGEQVPAVGFSIGFERIFCILSERGFQAPDRRKRIAVIYENDFINACKISDQLRADYDTALFEKPKKLGKLLSRLEEAGFNGFCQSDLSNEVSLFE